ncbi:hypothetical protein E1200_04120 [Actinomadura sp. GC306]|uniref:hypothetical protein n=1 Tax=Actinomadura sp. GC306 TaxID=2530367 RepID=UPI00104EE89A|nr:hypothetical protein [Actinomadura sp. GC306]TDC70800.1 hypothetical protein E1200_04120 [Actinomadura sp. GC306]
MAEFRSGDARAVPGGGHWRGRWWECRNCGPVERAISDLPQGDGVCPNCPDVPLELGRAQDPPQ